MCGESLAPLTVKVRDAMDTKLVKIEKDRPAIEALKLMIDNGVWSVVVTDKGVIVGVMTERDFIRRCILKGLDPNKTPVEKLMSCPLITIEADRPLGEALQLMTTKGVRRLFVTEGGKIIGRITQTELVEKTLDVFMALSSLQRQM
ncbi:MAG: CBS domain-containing protein [Thaumarchaeota archaeon]|jgi:predicted transcriptional regulator|nr:CBS domain-containing protein [Nitrososphaerota archaeon]